MGHAVFCCLAVLRCSVAVQHHQVSQEPSDLDFCLWPCLCYTSACSDQGKKGINLFCSYFNSASAISELPGYLIVCLCVFWFL